MQCDSSNVSSKKQATSSDIQHEVIPIHGFHGLLNGPTSEYRISIAALVNDDQRTELIVADVVQAVEDTRVPLVLTERTDHVQLFVESYRGEFQMFLL